MCDHIAGEVLVIHPRGSTVLENFVNAALASISPALPAAATRLVDELAVLGYPVSPERPSFQVVRVPVPQGAEHSAAGLVTRSFHDVVLSHLLTPGFFPSLSTADQDAFRDLVALPSMPLIAAAPNFVWPGRSLAGNGVSAADFVLDTTNHPNELRRLRATGGSPASAVTVAVVDTGVADDLAPRPAVGVDVFGQRNTNTIVTDEDGHGTQIAMIVHEVAPSATIVPIKVFAGPGSCSTDWHVIIGMTLASTADVIVAAIESGFDADQGISPCGATYGGTISEVARAALQRLTEDNPDAVFVAPAGNTGASQLAYPARLRDVVAVVGINRAGQRSSFSSHGTTCDDGSPHPAVFAAFGGDLPAAANPEGVGTDQRQTTVFNGTSHAAAYVAGALARYVALARDGGQMSTSRASLLAAIRAASTASGASVALPGGSVVAPLILP